MRFLPSDFGVCRYATGPRIYVGLLTTQADGRASAGGEVSTRAASPGIAWIAVPEFGRPAARCRLTISDFHVERDLNLGGQGM